MIENQVSLNETHQPRPSDVIALASGARQSSEFLRVRVLLANPSSLSENPLPNAADKVKAKFPDAIYGPPCSDDDIRRAAAALGTPLPAVLKKFYRAFNGFRGPTNAGFFWQLFASKKNPTGLVEMNRFFRDNAADPFPREIVSQCLFFGDDGIGAQWGFKKDLPGKIIKWDASWGTDIEIAGDSPLEAWLAEKAIYDEMERAQS